MSRGTVRGHMRVRRVTECRSRRYRLHWPIMGHAYAKLLALNLKHVVVVGDKEKRVCL